MMIPKMKIRLYITISLLLFNLLAYSQDPVAYFPFNGNTNDESGNSNNANPLGGVLLTSDRFGNANSAYIFDGVDDYMTSVINLSTNQPFSLSVWVYWNGANAGFQEILSWWNSAQGQSPYLGTGLNSSEIRFGDTWNATGINMPVNRWVHLGAVYDGNTSSLYLDGVFAAISGSGLNYDFTNGSLEIGKQAQFTEYWDGKIDDIRIYNRTLSATEIDQLFTEGGWSTLNIGLVADYPINGNANDESGNLRHGSVFGAFLTNDRSAVLNSAYQFDGIDDRIDLPFSPNNFAQLTITAWVFRTKNSLLGINQGIVSNDVLGNRGVSLAIDESNNLSITAHNTSIIQTQIFGSFIPTSQWVFVAMTYDGATLSLYQDGIFQGSIGSTGLLGGTSNFQIGHDLFDASSGRYFGGKIDQVRIYDRGLTAQEVEDIHLPVTPSGLIAYYPFNANANDESGNGQDGTVFGPILTDDRDGNFSSAYQFDGFDDYIQLPFSSNGLAQLSITAWINRTKNGSAGFTIGIVSNDVLVSDRGILLGLGDTNDLITIINNQSNIESRVNPLVFVPSSQWVFVAMTYDGIELKLYQDGVLTGTTSTSGLLRGTTTFHIGHDQLDGFTQRYFGGKIDDVKIFKTALTQIEIQQEMSGSIFTNINAGLEGIDIGDADWGGLRWGRRSGYHCHRP